jgi:hypothetical protein
MSPLWHLATQTGKRPPMVLLRDMNELVDLGDGQGWPKTLVLLPDVGHLYPCYISRGLRLCQRAEPEAAEFRVGRACSLSHQEAPMPPIHYSPKLPTRPCWHCTAFGGMTAQGTAALCNRPGCCRVRPGPAAGRSDWEREVGTDDGPVHPDFRGSTAKSPDDVTRLPSLSAQPVPCAP